MKSPILKEGQAAVLMADGATGAVLNIDLEFYNKKSAQEVYLIFDSIDSAKEFVKNKSVLHDKIEFIIFDDKQNMLEYIKASYWNTISDDPR